MEHLPCVSPGFDSPARRLRGITTQNAGRETLDSLTSSG